MIFIYPVGLPCVYLFVLYWFRKQLRSIQNLQDFLQNDGDATAVTAESRVTEQKAEQAEAVILYFDEADEYLLLLLTTYYLLLTTY